MAWHIFSLSCTNFKTRTLHASDESLGLGMESHVCFPAIYTASTLRHALGYAFPTNLFGDNLYYSVVLELEVSTSDIARECNHGEVLVNPHGCILIRNVYIFFNVDIGKGSPRCGEWNPADELLPGGPLLGCDTANHEYRMVDTVVRHRQSAWWTR